MKKTNLPQPAQSAAAKPIPPGAGFTPGEMAAMSAARRGASAGTPAAVRDAFLGQAIQVGEVTLPVIMLGHVLLLQKIESPLVKEGQAYLTNEQICEALFVLNSTTAEVLGLLRHGRDVFEEAALTWASTKVPLLHMREIGAALMAQIAMASSTVIGSSRHSSAGATAEGSSQPSPASSGEGAGAGGLKKNPPVSVTSGDRGQRSEVRAQRSDEPAGSRQNQTGSAGC